MKSGGLKYILIYCFAIALLFKTRGAVSVFVNSIKTIEYGSANQDSTDKEEQKIETEYFDSCTIIFPILSSSVQLNKKILLHQNFFFLSYYAEVLTPPPSSES